MDIDEFEIEKINFRPVAKGLGFHKSEKGLSPIKRQKTRSANPIRHKLTPPLSSMDMESFYNPTSQDIQIVLNVI